MSYADRKSTWMEKDTRVPLPKWVPLKVKNELVAAIGEFVGTVLFLLFAFTGTQIANSPAATVTPASAVATATGSNPPLLMYISLSFGFSLAVNAWVFYRISGGLFNPAVTLGMLIAGALKPVRAVVIFIAQILGGIASAAIVSALFPGALKVKTTLGGNTTIVQGLFIEMFLTAELVFTIFMLAAEKSKATFLAPIGIGLSLFIAELAGVYYTGGSLNPARSFGPCVVLHNFESYHWIYWIGPFLGAIVAAGFYKFIKVLEYESANPDQDHDDTVVTGELRPTSSRQREEDQNERRDELENEKHSPRRTGDRRRQSSSDFESNNDAGQNDTSRRTSKRRSDRPIEDPDTQTNEVTKEKDLLTGEPNNDDLIEISPTDAVSQNVHTVLRHSGNRRSRQDTDLRNSIRNDQTISSPHDVAVTRRSREDYDTTATTRHSDQYATQSVKHIRRRSAMEDDILRHGSRDYAINPENVNLINLDL